MHILLLTPQLPYPPHQGTTIRNWGLIHHLARRHQVSLLSFLEPGQALERADPLLEVCAQVETVPTPPARSLARRACDTLIRPLPDMALRLASPAFAERLVAWLDRAPFDVVHVEGIEMTPYLDRVLERVPVVILDDHNCEYKLQKSYAQIDARIPRRWPGALYSFIQWQKLRRYEASVCRRAHHVLAVSETDAQALCQIVPNLDITLIPNGIDADQYTPIYQSTTNAPTLIFTGKMDFRPNVDAVRWFADQIWPLVRAAAPDAHFFVVGQRPHSQLDDLRDDPSLTLTGWVDDMRPYISQATVYVAPLRMGSGTRLKLLEAMAWGKAIVSTRMGAEGLTQATGDAPALVQVDDDDPLAFAGAVIALLQDPERRVRLGRAARAFVETHYDWRVIIPRLEALYARQREDR